MSLPRNTETDLFISPSLRENLDRQEQQSKSPPVNTRSGRITDGGKRRLFTTLEIPTAIN